jgi:hypothetical protein
MFREGRFILSPSVKDANDVDLVIDKSEEDLDASLEAGRTHSWDQVVSFRSSVRRSSQRETRPGQSSDVSFSVCGVEMFRQIFFDVSQMAVGV